MPTSTEDIIAAGIRQQIEFLRTIDEELQQNDITPNALAWRLRAVEIQIRRLRESTARHAMTALAF